MANNPDITINGASVKVMRSYDYCHFEISLSSAGTEPLTSVQVDEMRKDAMRLADKAVEQYKVARKVEDHRLHLERKISMLTEEVESIEKNIPEGELTPEHKAKIKALADFEFEMQFEYDYQDEWDW